jgi:hypothetical protein
MRPLAPKLSAMLLSLVALAGCQKPDVGAPCTLQWGTDPAVAPPTPQTAAGDYFQSGNTTCDDLVCIVSPITSGKYADRCTSGNGDGCGYCSKPCVSNQDCSTDETGLVCDLILPDPAFLARLDELDPGVRERYLGEIAFSSYCVIPR